MEDSTTSSCLAPKKCLPAWLRLLMSSNNHLHCLWKGIPAAFREHPPIYIYCIIRYVYFDCQKSVRNELTWLQCIVLATRPLLFCFLKIRFESQSKCTELLGSSQTVRNLIQMCIDSSQQMVSILDCLQSQGLLGESSPRLIENQVLLD